MSEQQMKSQSLCAFSSKTPCDIRPILEGVKEGRQECLAELYDQFSGLVFSTAMRILRSHTTAEDILQEVFLHVWRFPDSYITAHSNLAAWFTVVTKNKAIDSLRKKRPSVSCDTVEFPATLDLSRDTERSLMCQRARLISLSLPPEQREALDLAFFGELSHSEIAELTGQPMGTVKTRIRTALLSIKAGLQKPPVMHQKTAPASSSERFSVTSKLASRHEAIENRVH